MTEVYVIPLETKDCTTWPKIELPKPYPRNLTETWTEPDKLDPLRGLKSNDKYVLCVGGPLHRIKLRRQHKMYSGNRTPKRKFDLVGIEPFSVPPWRGWYKYDQEKDRFVWSM